MRYLLALCLLFPTARVLAANHVVLPLHFERDIPVVTLRIDGRDVPFMLDTGASDSIYLTPDDAKLIPGVTRTGKNVQSFDLNGNTVDNAEIVVDDLLVGGMHFGKLTGRIRSPWGVSVGSLGPPPISVLGLRFFAHKKVLFDFAALRVTLWEAAAPQPDEVSNWTLLPYERTDEGVLVSLASATRTYRVVLDTASTISLLKRSSVPADEVTRPCDIQMQPDVPCRRVTVTLARGSSFTPVLMDMPQAFEADGIVGREFFDRCGVYLDFAGHVIRVSPRAIR
jgi:hypothetical protein